MAITELAAAANGIVPGEFANTVEAVRELDRRVGATHSCLKSYEDADGRPVGAILRSNAEGAPDRHIVFAPDGKTCDLREMPSPRPLYRLPSLLLAEIDERVYVVENERSVDVLASLGLLGTTSLGGSGDAEKSDWSVLKGLSVIAVVTNDESVDGYATVATRLALAAGARSVRVIRLRDIWPEMPKGGDIADLLADRSGDVDKVRSEVEALAVGTAPSVVTPRTPPAAAFVPFPVEVLPEPVRSFVIEAARAMQCDPCNVALPLLSGLASAIGNTRQVELKRAWCEPAILWTVVVGESGMVKSDPVKAALKPIYERQGDAFRTHDDALREHEAAMEVHERRLAQMKNSKSDAERPAKPETPTATRYVVDDLTTEALAVLLKQNSRGLLCAKDELAGWFDFDRYAGGKGGDAAKWLEMFRGQPITVDRKSGGGTTIHVPRASVSITGTIQPKVLNRTLGELHRDNGLAARFLIAHPPRRMKRWGDSDLSPTTEAALKGIYERLYDLTGEPDGKGGERPQSLRFEPDAKREWAMFYNEHNVQQMVLTGEDAAAWSKLEGYAARLAMVIHLTRDAARDPSIADHLRIDMASLAAAVTLVRWFGAEAARVYSAFSESPRDAESRRRLVELIERKGGDVSAREMVQACRAFKSVSDAETALSRLVEEGLGSWQVPAQCGPGGPKAKRFKLADVYGVNVYSIATGGTENGDSVDVDGVDVAGVAIQNRNPALEGA